MQLNRIVVLSLLVLVVGMPAAGNAQKGPAGDEPTAPTEPVEPNIPLTPQSPVELPVPMPAFRGAEPAGGAKGSEGDAPTGYSGGDLVITDTSPALYGERSGGGRSIPAYHIVKEGETLWDLCVQYYADPWTWPQLWAFNKSITNPHWIYPGDRIRLMGAGRTATRRSDDSDERLVAPTQPAWTQYKAVRLRQRAMVEDKDLASSGRIIGSREEKWMLSRFDEMYVEKGKEMTPEHGKLYSIYRIREELTGRDKERVGYLVEILGTARIKRTEEGKAATAVIVEAFGPVERDDRVGPLRRTFRTMPERTATKDLDAQVIANLDETKVVGSDRVVFLDRGRKQGVQLGNRFLVVRQGDGFETIIPGEGMDEDVQKNFPEETVAEISVLDVKDNAAMGLVTRALREVRTGDKARMRKGY